MCIISQIWTMVCCAALLFIVQFHGQIPLVPVQRLGAYF